MLFSSYQYLFLFLPITFAAFWLCACWMPRTGLIAMLVLASLVFYAWSAPVFLILLSLSIVINYLGGLWLLRSRSKSVLVVLIVVNCLPLAFYKYTNFILSSAADVLGWAGCDLSLPTLKLALPLGISYFTFVQIACLVDVYRKAVMVSFVDYAFHVSFFPKMIAGPITRCREIVPQLGRGAFTRFHQRHLYLGLLVFMIGLGKKVLLADPLGAVADWGWGAHELPIDAASCWLTTFCYTLQLYFDFSGYSDMAWGSAMLFNVKLPINFLSPYKADSIQDFWRRWHISLSRWLRDYLYFSFGGSRCSLPKTIRNVFLTFLIGGIWHGAGWTFVVWGAMHGVALSVCNLWRKLQRWRIPKFVGWVLTIVFVHFAWVFFRAPTVSSALDMIMGMFGGHAGIATSAYDWAFANAWFTYGIIILALSLLPCPSSMQMAFFALRYFRRFKVQVMFGIWCATALFLSLLRILAKNIEPSPFVYSQF